MLTVYTRMRVIVLRAESWRNVGGDGNESLNSLSLLKKMVEAPGVSGTRTNLLEKSAVHMEAPGIAP
jgi:hypothetical protein